MSADPQLVAKLFDRGPFFRSGEPRGRVGTITLSGKVAPGQGTAYAAAAVPVIQQSDYLVPADPQGRPASFAVAKPLEIRVDSFLAFQVDVQASWWTGVDGVLMALLYDIDVGDRNFVLWLEGFRRAHPMLPLTAPFDLQMLVSAQIAASTSATEAMTPGSPGNVPKRMQEALAVLLGQKAAQLSTGLLKIQP